MTGAWLRRVLSVQRSCSPGDTRIHRQLRLSALWRGQQRNWERENGLQHSAETGDIFIARTLASTVLEIAFDSSRCVSRVLLPLASLLRCFGIRNKPCCKRNTPRGKALCKFTFGREGRGTFLPWNPKYTLTHGKPSCPIRFAPPSATWRACLPRRAAVSPFPRNDDDNDLPSTNDRERRSTRAILDMRDKGLVSAGDRS